MKRVLGLVVLCGAASCLCATAAPLKKPPAVSAPAKTSAAQKAAAKAAAEQAHFLTLAPADEYFGPLKQSVIGINNTIRTLGWNYDVNHDIGDQTFASAALTERAIMDWKKKYPKDDQLPKALYLIQRLYTKVLTQTSRDHSKFIADILLKSYGSSPQAKQLKKTLASEHLAPLPPPTPMPTPVPSYPSIFGPAYQSEFGTAPAPKTPEPSAAPPAAADTATPPAVSTTATPAH